MAPSTVCIRETLADRLPKPVIAPSASLSKKASDVSVPTPVMLPEINMGSLKSAVAVSVPVPVISAEAIFAQVVVDNQIPSSRLYPRESMLPKGSKPSNVKGPQTPSSVQLLSKLKGKESSDPNWSNCSKVRDINQGLLSDCQN
jgi:hypothetical protein